MSITKVNHKQGNFYQNTAASIGLKERPDVTKDLIKAVLHSVRDNVDLDTAIHILSNLPNHLKSIFNENWKPSKNPQSLRPDFQLISEVEAKMKLMPSSILNLEQSIRQVIFHIDKESGNELTLCFNRLYPRSIHCIAA